MSIKTWFVVFAVAFALLGAYVAYDQAMDLLNQKSDAAVAAGYAILVGLFCGVVSTFVWVWKSIAPDDPEIK